MGQNGVDVILSPAAQKIFDLAVECKNVEKLNVVTTFTKHYEHYKNHSSLKILVHSRNRTEPMVTLRLEDFLGLLERATVRSENTASSTS